MKRRVCCILTAAVMAVTMCSIDLSVVWAAPDKTTARGTIDNGLFDTLGDGSSKSSQSTYVDGEALVLYESSAQLSTKKAESTLTTQASDISVEKIWTFADDGDSEGLSLFSSESNSSADNYLNVALVSSGDLSTKQIISALDGQDGIKYVEPNYRLKASSNDSYFSNQWSIENTGQNGGTSGIATNADKEWASGTKGSDDVVVAVLDTGIDYSHEDLKDNMWHNDNQPTLKGVYGYDFVNRDSDPMDDNGHGTHVAGIIGATGDNSTGISGVSQETSLMALKILDEEGNSYEALEVDAYYYINKALDLGVNVKAINNSWGGGESEIFGSLIDLVGSKGAVTVVAAGNDGLDLDESGATYPLDTGSKYMISVAAMDENGQLAGYSNYGHKTVDVAAPGTDILSTVNYNCYNPSLYSSSKQEDVSACYEDYDSGDPSLIPDTSEESSTYRTSDEGSDSSCEITTDGGIYFGTGGKSMQLNFKDMSSGEYACVSIPYTIDEDASETYASAMVKLNSSENSGVFYLLDLPADADTTDPSTLIEEYYYAGHYYDDESEWHHMRLGLAEGDSATDRQLVILTYAEESGDYTANLDDLGISKSDVSDQFGQYEFMSGSSMAAPQVSGAIALLASADKGAGAEDLIDETLSHIRKTDDLSDKVIEGGMLDFSSSDSHTPRVTDITVNTKDSSITFTGRNLNGATSVTINGEEVTIKSNSKTEVVVDGTGLINTRADITVTTDGGTAEKSDVYLVKGKTDYSSTDTTGNFNEWTGAVADNDYVYVTDSAGHAIYRADLDEDALSFEKIYTLDAKTLFDDDTANATIEIVSDPVLIDGKLYAIVGDSLTQEDQPEQVDDEWFYAMSTAYATDYALICLDPSLIDAEDSEEAPVQVIDMGTYFKKYEDITLASYDGQLYFIGGYNYAGDVQAPDTQVIAYDPSSRKWSIAPSLPSGRAGGRALQTDHGIVYTMGYSADQKGKDIYDQTCPVNLIYDGTQWTESKAELEPYIAADTVVRDEETYVAYTACIGLTRGGLVYMGTPCAGLGDTFTYSVAKDQFTATEYNYITELDGSQTFSGIAIGDQVIGYNNDGEFSSFAIESGYVNVKDASSTGGSVEGADTDVVPGTQVKLTPVADDNCYYMSGTLQIDGTAADSGTTLRVNDNSHQVTADFGRYVTKISLNKTYLKLKKNKTYTLKATVTPSGATNKGVTWTTSNKKYATVTSAGKVRTKKKGRHHTVTITAKAKDGHGAKATCRIKIK